MGSSGGRERGEVDCCCQDEAGESTKLLSGERKFRICGCASEQLGARRGLVIPLLRGEAVQPSAPATGRIYLWLVCFLHSPDSFSVFHHFFNDPQLGQFFSFLLSFFLYFHCYAFLDLLNFLFLFDLRVSGLKFADTTCHRLIQQRPIVIVLVLFSSLRSFFSLFFSLFFSITNHAATCMIKL